MSRYGLVSRRRFWGLLGALVGVFGAAQLPRKQRWEDIKAQDKPLEDFKLLEHYHGHVSEEGEWVDGGWEMDVYRGRIILSRTGSPFRSPNISQQNWIAHMVSRAVRKHWLS